MRVYIVDDSPLVTDRLVSLFRKLDGLEMVGSADNADEAVTNIATCQPDVVVLDIRMTSGSGISVLKEIKKGDNPPTVIMLTNYPYPNYRTKCIEAGADYFFDKSNEFEMVIEVLGRLIAQKDGTSS